MCCCGQPIINGQMGYKWQPNDTPSIRKPYPPATQEDEIVLFDEPGRCGGMDAHSHHYQVIKWLSSYHLVVQHGGGRESFRLSTTKHFLSMLESLDTNTRYWLLHALYHAYSDGEKRGQENTSSYWRSAAAEKRIKVKKLRNQNLVKVLVEPPRLQEVS